jgi:2-polyprenyl-6-methoxyphenol hydroxylase-like FAD-dependent oxidoreductase
MRWLKPKLTSSFYAIFSVSQPVSPTTAVGAGVGMEDIREAMLALTAMDNDERALAVTRRIRYAADLEALWYIRGELMGLLARTHGEAVAREMLEDLSVLFTDLLPRGLRSRPSPLSESYRASRPGSDE